MMNQAPCCIRGADSSSCHCVQKCQCAAVVGNRITPKCSYSRNPALCLIQPAMKVAKGIQELTDRSPAPPVACHICSDEFEEAYNHEANVFHGKSNLHNVAYNPTCSLANRCSIRVDLSLVLWLVWFVILLKAHSCDFMCLLL